MDAIAREKKLKAGPRKKKVALINKYNPEWKDLFDMVADEAWDEGPLAPARTQDLPETENSTGIVKT